MRYLFILVVLVACQPAIAQTANTNSAKSIEWSKAFPEYLKGDFEIRHSSARPAARAYYLLRAAAYDQYAIESKDVLAAHPPLARLVKDAVVEDMQTFQNYQNKFSVKFAPIVNRQRELADLEKFVASGYSGDLRPKLLAYIEELKVVATVPWREPRQWNGAETLPRTTTIQNQRRGSTRP